MSPDATIQLALWVGGGFAFGFFLAATSLSSKSKSRE